MLRCGAYYIRHYAVYPPSPPEVRFEFKRPQARTASCRFILLLLGRHPYLPNVSCELLYV